MNDWQRSVLLFLAVIYLVAGLSFLNSAPRNLEGMVMLYLSLGVPAMLLLILLKNMAAGFMEKKVVNEAKSEKDIIRIKYKPSKSSLDRVIQRGLVKVFRFMDIEITPVEKRKIKKLYRRVN